jgi:serine O-acetyltransferase
MNIPRHPILEDNVTVYSNTSILGRVRIGHDTVIGGNVWLTHDVPPFSKVLQTRAVTTQVFDGGEGI